MARILFVDDDPFTLATLTKAVEVFGHRALVSGTGQQALELALNESPDMIFVDLSLPDMDGLALVNALHTGEGTAHIPVMVLSASPEIDASELARAAGAHAFLNKPIRLQTLIDTIQSFSEREESTGV